MNEDTPVIEIFNATNGWLIVDIDGKTYVSLDTEDMHETVSKILKANKSKLEREKNLAISIPDDYIDDPLVDED